MGRLKNRALLGLLTILFGLLLGPGAASAQADLDIDGGAGTVSGTSFAACQDERRDEFEGIATGESRHLAIDRWSDAAGTVHTRLGAKIVDDVDNKVARNWVGGTFLRFGNGMWQFGTGMTEFAARFDVLCSFGGDADNAAARIGNALAGNGSGGGVVPLLAVAGVVYLIVKKTRNQENPTGSLVRMAATIALFAILLNGATNTTYNPDSPENTRYGVGSPAWVALSVDEFLSSVANGPANALNGPDNEIDLAREIDESGLDAFHCDVYRNRLRTEYAEGFGDGPARWRSSVPLALSSMWEESGLVAWRDFQFGADNESGARVDCRLLDHFAGIPVEDQAALVAADGVAIPAEAFDYDSNTERDRAMILFAACVGNGSETVNDEWQNVEYRDGATDSTYGLSLDQCSRWGYEPGDIGDGAFEFIDSEGSVRERTENAPEARNFLLNFHGDSFGAGVTVAFFFMLSAFVMAFVFGSLALAVIIAKVVTVAALPVVMIVVAISIWPGKADDAKVAKFLKFYIGITVYTFLMAFVLSMVALVTNYLGSLGTSAAGQGSIIGSVWVGLSPLFAILAVHLMAKAAGLPSPFSPTAALGLATVLAGTGAAVGIGISQLGNRANRLRHGANAQRHRATAARHRAGRGEQSSDRSTSRQGRGTGGSGGMGRGAERNGSVDGSAENQDPSTARRSADAAPDDDDVTTASVSAAAGAAVAARTGEPPPVQPDAEDGEAEAPRERRSVGEWTREQVDAVASAGDATINTGLDRFGRGVQRAVTTSEGRRRLVSLTAAGIGASFGGFILPLAAYGATRVGFAGADRARAARQRFNATEIGQDWQAHRAASRTQRAPETSPISDGSEASAGSAADTRQRGVPEGVEQPMGQAEPRSTPAPERQRPRPSQQAEVDYFDEVGLPPDPGATDDDVLPPTTRGGRQPGRYEPGDRP